MSEGINIYTRMAKYLKCPVIQKPSIATSDYYFNKMMLTIYFGLLVKDTCEKQTCI